MNHERQINETSTVLASTTVLVADDDPITRQLLKRFLESKGHSVLTAKDGEEGWSLFVEHQPRMVITDWRMPKLDGVGLCKRIRECTEVAHYTCLLMLTSATDPETMAQGFAAGADDFMTKPFNRAELEWRLFAGLRVVGLHSALEHRIEELDEARSHLEDANRKMQEGLSAASNTQRALLPKVAPDVPGVNCSWSYEPSDHLGGDSLNLFQLTPTKVGFFIADVCGHGLPSALLAVTLHRVLTPVIGQAGLLTSDGGDALELFCNPGKVLTTVNQRLPMKIENGEYFTAVYGVIDAEKAELHYAGAGHPNPLLLAEGQPIAKLATEGLPIGFDDLAEYETQIVPLEPGNRLFVYSDGVAEAKNSTGEMYGIDRLAEKLESTSKWEVEDVVAAMVKNRADWEDGQEDDISMIFLEFAGSTDAALDEDPIQKHAALQNPTITNEQES